MIDINNTLDLIKLKFYNEWLYTAHIYDEGNSQMHENLTKEMITKYVDPLNLPKDAKILDLGCGPGYFLDGMKERKYTNVTGVTLSPVKQGGYLRYKYILYLGFDSRHIGYIYHPWERFESTLPLATQQ